MPDDKVYETRVVDWGFGQVTRERITPDGAALEVWRINLTEDQKRALSCDLSALDSHGPKSSKKPWWRTIFNAH